MIEGKLNQANGRLKAGKIGLTIQLSGQRLCLRGTLPPKPASPKTKPHQQRIYLGVYANGAGLQKAEKEARRIGGLLAAGNFNWSEFIETEANQNVAHWITSFEQDYFTKRKRTAETETTWRGDYLQPFKALDPSLPLTKEHLLSAIAKTEPDSRNRKRYCMAFAALAKFAGIELDTSELRGNYSPVHVAPKDLPTDEQIAFHYYQISDNRWRWVYGMMATYGLRNHEVFHLDLERFKNSEVLAVTGGKTGARRVYPIYPEWVEQFELKNVCIPACTGKNNSALGNRVTKAFSRLQIPFNPYLLRHAWAVRSMEYGLDPSLSAIQMGHSFSVHTSVYWRWISDFQHERAFQLLLNRSDRPQPPSVNNRIR